MRITLARAEHLVDERPILAACHALELGADLPLPRSGIDVALDDHAVAAPDAIR